MVNRCCTAEYETALRHLLDAADQMGAAPFENCRRHVSLCLYVPLIAVSEHSCTHIYILFIYYRSKIRANVINITLWRENETAIL
ncbi:hypothetical protein Y032_0255g332 [Ancylostoma ceylanicum]|uniref:Uncharacterized protein n=1 Tax=Ancylostoma ceylanicum TaxID=53326 RepID=A0A016SB98_9BILA|nr:hypothetical protein Y032_0255g332 [Ancylostoma ceylanicum]